MRPRLDEKKNIFSGVIAGIVFTVVWLVLDNFESPITAILAGVVFTIVWIGISLIHHR